MAKLSLSFGHVFAYILGTLFSVIWYYLFIPWATGDFDPDFFNSAFEKTTIEEDDNSPQFGLPGAIIGNVLIVVVVHYIFKNYHEKRTWHQNLFLALWIATICVALQMHHPLATLQMFFNFIHTYILLIIIILIMHTFKNSHIRGAHCFQSEDKQENDVPESQHSDDDSTGEGGTLVSTRTSQTAINAQGNVQPEETTTNTASERNNSGLTVQERHAPEQCTIEMTNTADMQRMPHSLDQGQEMTSAFYLPEASTSQGGPFHSGAMDKDIPSVEYEPIPPPRRKRRWSDSTFGESRPLLLNI